MKYIQSSVMIVLLPFGLSACTTHQQQRLLAATEAAAVTALEYKARGASGELAASGGIVAGLIAYKTPPAPPAPAGLSGVTSAK